MTKVVGLTMNDSEMKNWQSRQIALIGEENTNKLRATSVLIFGIGGVGGYTTEALARAGVGRIVLVDGDVFSESNLNRQIMCTVNTVGFSKSEAAKNRVLSINPLCDVRAVDAFADETNTEKIISDAAPDFVVDAIDTVKTKLIIAKYCTENGISLISSMGTGNKLDMTKLKISDISKTSVCPLAKAVRVELRKMGITKLPVVYSEELPVRTGERIPASISYVPAAAGLLLAQYVINRIIGDEK